VVLVSVVFSLLVYIGVVLEYMFCSCAWFPFGCDKVWFVVKMVGKGYFVVLT
jgi:hypothetical protein